MHFEVFGRGGTFHAFHVPLGQVFGLGILGFALTEAVALFALLIAFLILFT